LIIDNVKNLKEDNRMAEYPKELIEKLDAQCTKEGWPLIGLYLVAMIATAVLLYVVGAIANSLLS
jgi:hypothetical protein